MATLAETPRPPYYAVIFSSVRTDGDNSYSSISDQMFDLASLQEGFLGVDSARNEVGITVSYWKDIESIKNWKLNAGHTLARERGRSEWYSQFRVRVAKVERDYGFVK